MVKHSTIYVCQKCGMQSPKWMGRCPDCGAWESFVEEASPEAPERRGEAAEMLSMEEAFETQESRIPAGMAGMERLLGGGWVPGSVVLLGGEPGVGKSTLMLQLSALMAGKEGETLYISGEESCSQVAMRAARLGVVRGVTLVSETAVEPILTLLEEKSFSFVVVDSIQTLYDTRLASAPGSVSQVRAVTAALTRLAKKKAFVLILVGHVTKEGAIAGPRTLEHMVDVVLYFEGDLEHQYRLLRSHKNRFGSTFELVVFEMTEHGLVEQDNPSRLFLSHRDAPPPGTVITGILAGTQPLLLEVQALCVVTPYSIPRRTAVGMEIQRLHLLSAVMIRHGLNLANMDLYLNVAGGFPIKETGADLAAVAAMASALYNRALPRKSLFIGEVGLTGEVRPVPHLLERLKEAKQHGLAEAWIPEVDLPSDPGIKIHTVAHISAVIALVR